MARDICAKSEPLYLEKAPPAAPVVSVPRVKKFNDHVDADLWCTPDGGVSDYVLHMMDAKLEFSVLEYLDSKDSVTLVAAMEEKWNRRFLQGPKSWGFDADSVFNSRTVDAFCGATSAELRSRPGGAHWSAGRLERRNMTIGYVWRRLVRLRPNATKQELAQLSCWGNT